MIRTRTSLDGIWDFFPDPQRQIDPHNLEHHEPARKIEVPGPWQAQFEDLRDYTGVVWYRRSFELPSPSEHIDEPTWILHFGAVDYHTTVWLNDHLLGDHEGGYLPFEFTLDRVLARKGTNKLVVRVIKPSSDAALFPEYPFTETPHGKQSWYGPIGGIWQSVFLEARHTFHLTQLRITPDVPHEQAHVLVRLNRPGEQRFVLQLAVTDPHGQVATHDFAFGAGEQQILLSVPVPNPLLWDTLSPQLYRLEATLIDPESTENKRTRASVDSLSSTFGMRTIATSPDGHLTLNGRTLYLRGALDQDYYPRMIYTPFSDAELDEQFAKAKHMGLNCLRTHIKITDPRYYAAADRIGLLIWTELPNWENLTDEAKRRARETLTGMVERDWNHPSIVIWTIINEGWGVELAVNPEHRAWLVETYTYLKELDPHRLVVGNSPCLSNFHVITDIEDFHNYYAIPDHYRKWRDWVHSFASRPSWTFAHVYENINAWREFHRDPWNPLPRTPAPEVRRRGNEPMVVSEFGNWGLPDVAKLRECYGGEPWWFETGLEWGDGVVYPHGIEQRFKAFHLDKVFPTLSDLAAASQRMQFTALKYEIEQIRRYPNIVGYIITEFTDVHWECNGLLDMCRNPKAFYDVIGQINSADAIVPDWERIVFWEGERCEVRLTFSHFSTSNLHGSRLEWHVDLWPEIHGSFEQLMPQPTQVTTIGTIVFNVPPLQQSVRARVEFRLLDTNGSIVTCNHQELYFFPRSLAAPPATRNGPVKIHVLGSPALAERLEALGYHLTDCADADVILVETMTDETRWHLQNGGRVLWLAEQPDSKQTYLGSVGIAQRAGRSWQGDWASNFNWIRQDRMFRDLPSGGTVDFAFADLIPDQVIVGLSPSNYDADVHAGLFVGWLHHTVALIAERRFGNGRLLVSTFHISEHVPTNPVARVMLNDMLAYVTRPAAKS